MTYVTIRTSCISKSFKIIFARYTVQTSFESIVNVRTPFPSFRCQVRYFPLRDITTLVTILRVSGVLLKVITVARALGGGPNPDRTRPEVTREVPGCDVTPRRMDVQYLVQTNMGSPNLVDQG